MASKVTRARIALVILLTLLCQSCTSRILVRHVFCFLLASESDLVSSNLEPLPLPALIDIISAISKNPTTHHIDCPLHGAGHWENVDRDPETGHVRLFIGDMFVVPSRSVPISVLDSHRLRRLHLELHAMLDRLQYWRKELPPIILEEFALLMESSVLLMCELFREAGYGESERAATLDGSDEDGSSDSSSVSGTFGELAGDSGENLEETVSAMDVMGNVPFTTRL